MDMSAAYAGGVGRKCPEAELCYDHFHVFQKVTEAVDEARKDEQKTLADSDLRLPQQSQTPDCHTVPLRRAGPLPSADMKTKDSTTAIVDSGRGWNSICRERPNRCRVGLTTSAQSPLQLGSHPDSTTHGKTGCA